MSRMLSQKKIFELFSSNFKAILRGSSFCPFGIVFVKILIWDLNGSHFNGKETK